MQVISHRGYWLDKAERNQPVAFARSFDLGFGTETDVRDRAGTLVIAHDMPNGSEITLDDLLDIMDSRNLPLAINIKADGLAQALRAKFAERGHSNWFAFDMAVPDMRAYLRAGVPTYTRLSDVEPAPAWTEHCAGIWLDSLEGDWIKANELRQLLSSGKPICFVSPELHGRAPEHTWSWLKTFEGAENLTICTDLPETFQKKLKEAEP